MSWKSDYSISKLFVNKRVVTISNDSKFCKFIVPSIKDSFTDSNLGKFFGLIDDKTLIKLESLLKVNSSLEVIKRLLSDPLVTNLKEFKTFNIIIDSTLHKYLQNFSVTNNREMMWNGNVIDEELWSEFVNLLCNCCGVEHSEKELKFANEAARKLWEQQQAAEAKIAQIRGENSAGDDNFIKACLQISYAIPSISMDELYDLSFKQFKFLQEIVKNYPSYQIESMAYAMGNLKEAPAFFIK